MLSFVCYQDISTIINKINNTVVNIVYILSINYENMRDIFAIYFMEQCIIKQWINCTDLTCIMFDQLLIRLLFFQAHTYLLLSVLFRIIDHKELIKSAQ